MSWRTWLGLEHRETSYTETVIAQSLESALVDATSLGVVEACAGLWGRAFAAAESDTLPASVLARIGRSLLLNGECIYLIDGLAEAATWDITGGVDEVGWQYRLDLPGPSSTTTARRPASAVLHFRIGQTKARPWKGASPLERAGLTRGLLACIEQSLRYEFSGPVGHVLPVPAGSTQTQLASDVAALRGQVALGETTAGGHGEGRAASPQKDWVPARIGPAPLQATAILHENIERTILAACGVPADLAGSSSAEAGTRESWRRFVASTIAPVGRIVGAEVKRKMGGTGLLRFSSLRAADTQGNARSWAALVKAGMPKADASRVVGFEK